MIHQSKEAADIICRWWRGLQPDPARGQKGARAALARLRHAPTLLAAAMEPETLSLCRALSAQVQDMQKVALIAAILADLREDVRGETFARALGTPEDKPICSFFRFRRLLEATEPEAQLIAFRRALALLKHRGNLRDLAESLLDWNDTRRQRWLYDYYQTNNPASSAVLETQP